MSGLFENWQRPTFPHKCSIIGAGGLNFSVRNGKRWTPPQKSPKDLKNLYIKLKTTYLTKENTIVHDIEVYIK